VAVPYDVTPSDPVDPDAFRLARRHTKFNSSELPITKRRRRLVGACECGDVYRERLGGSNGCLDKDTGRNASRHPRPLATGQVDAIDMDFEGAADYKFYDHLNTLLLTNHDRLSSVALVSAQVWSKLSPSDQDIMRSVMQNHLEMLKQTIIAQEQDFLEQLRGSPLKIREMDAASFGPAVAQWDKNWLPRAPILKEMREVAAQL
jgi:extracellular solute-binding protein (family 7)